MRVLGHYGGFLAKILLNDGANYDSFQDSQSAPKPSLHAVLNVPDTALPWHVLAPTWLRYRHSLVFYLQQVVEDLKTDPNSRLLIHVNSYCALRHFAPCDSRQNSP